MILFALRVFSMLIPELFLCFLLLFLSGTILTVCCVRI